MIFYTEHRPGNCHHNEDYLSRPPCPEYFKHCRNVKEKNIGGSAVAIRATGVVAHDWSPAELSREQCPEPELKQFID